MTKSILVVLLIITGAIFVAGAWYAIGRRVVRGEKYSPYSTYRSDRVGTRRLFLFYESAGLEPVRLKRELLMLEGGGLLFIIEPQMTVLPSMTGQPLTGHGTFLRQEMERIITWVSEGNSLVLAVSGQTELHERLGVTVESGAPCRRRNALRVQLSPLTRSLGRIETRSDSCLVLDEPVWVGLFSASGDGESEPRLQAAVRKLGSGTVVVLSDPFVLTNKGIMSAPNLTLAARLAGMCGNGRIYFDEYHHGFSDPRTIVSYIRARGLHFAMFQVLAIFALFVWRSRSRLGKPRSLGGMSERGSAEYVRAFSLIYRRAGLQGSVVRSACDLFTRKTALWAGLGQNSDAGEIRAVLEGRNPGAAARFKAIVTRAKRAGADVGNAEVLTMMKSIAVFEKEFLNAGKRARKVT